MSVIASSGGGSTKAEGVAALLEVASGPQIVVAGEGGARTAMEAAEGAVGAESLAQALLIPLKSGERVTGAIVLGSMKAGAFSPTDADFYEAVGAEAGVSLENALIYREIALEHERLTTLYRSAQAISGQADLRELLNATAAEAAGVVGGRSALLALVEQGRSDFLWGASYNLDLDSLKSVRLKADSGLGGEVLRTKRAVFLSSGEPLPEYLQEDPVVEVLGVGSAIAVPLISGDRVVGVLGVHDLSGKGEVGEEDVRLLEALGRQAGVAIEKARLYDETKSHLEALENANRELMTLDKMKSDFVSTVSHELRSPLAVIGGFAKTLVEHFDQIDRETEKESIEIILKKSIALEGLIENILDMSRIESGRLEVSVEPVDIVALCEAVKGEQSRVAEAHEIVFEAEREEITAVADPDKVEVAVSNLLRNAVKFSPGGGRVLIRAREAGDMAEISVSDEGIGIPPDELDRIFERFYQVDQGETRTFQGSGLGLHITSELVKAMGGSIKAESEPGEGATFTFSLPLAR